MKLHTANPRQTVRRPLAIGALSVCLIAGAATAQDAATDPSKPVTVSTSADTHATLEPRPTRRAWPIRVLAAIGEFLIPSAHAGGPIFNSDVESESSDPDFVLDDTDHPDTEWFLSADGPIGSEF